MLSTVPNISRRSSQETLISESSKDSLVAPDPVARKKRDTADTSYAKIWDDFLANRWDSVQPRAKTCIQLLESSGDNGKLANDWINEADYNYILGATYTTKFTF